MKVGIIRRIDDLGRIVIPKSIRNSLRIRSGDNLEIFIEEKNIILKKYSEVIKVKQPGKILVEVLKKKINGEVYLTDKDKFILGNEKYKNKEISNDILEYINNRNIEIKNEVQFTNKELEKGNIYVNPLIIRGDTYGSLIINSKEKLEKTKLEIVETIKEILVKNLE